MSSNKLLKLKLTTKQKTICKFIFYFYLFDEFKVSDPDLRLVFNSGSESDNLSGSATLNSLEFPHISIPGLLDLVYTFFHPLLRDEEETSIHIQKLKGTYTYLGTLVGT